MFWWGSKTRSDRTESVNSLFAKQHPGVSITGQSLDFTNYWTVLATQAAGGGMADIVQMDFRYIRQYANGGALLALDPFMPKTLDIADFGTSAIDAGRVDGKLYGVNLGLSSTCSLYDTVVFESAGLKAPDPQLTWSGLGDIAEEVTKWGAKNGRSGFWGVQDAGGLEPSLEVWLRERGRLLYGQDGRIGFNDDDITEWFSYWQTMRERGACAPPDVQALDRQSIETSLLTLGKAAIVFLNSNQLVGAQQVNKDRLGITTDPSGGPGAKPGPYLRASQYFSVSSRTKSPETAVALVNFFVENPQAAEILGVERGIPASERIRNSLAPGLSPLDRASSDYISLIASTNSPPSPPPPKGAGEIDAMLPRFNEQVGFKRLTPKDAAHQFVEQARTVLANA